MKILITGGNGFIGTHITKQLLEQNHEVVIYDNFSTSKRPSVISQRSSANTENSQKTEDRRLTTIEGDINDAKKLQESLQGVDAVIHMASFTSVEESVKSPLKYMQNNVLGAATLLEAMRSSGVKKIIFSSSATVYGTPKSLPITEDQPISAANPYGASKIAVEALCESFAKTDGFDVIILRYFNPYGPGEKHLPETHAIPNFIKAALEKRPIPLYWKGEQVRDFIYVEDLAAAHIAVLNLSGYQVFNVGTKSGTKIIDVVNELSDIFGYNLTIEDKGDRPGDVIATYASSSKLHEATGWQAKVDLKDGLKQTVEWFRASENLKRKA
jgi:UDP-glucose 4-epimerase